MKILRILLGIIYPSMCLIISSIMLLALFFYQVNFINISFIITALAVIPFFISSLIMEFIINPKINSHIFSVFLGGCLGLMFSVFFMGLICIKDSLSYESFADIISISIVLFSLGIIATLPLRYLFIKNGDYKIAILFIYMIVGLFMFVVITYSTYELNKLMIQAFKSGLPSLRDVSI